MKFELTILGCGSALPTLEKNPTSQVLNICEKFFLIDCGEGTQIQLRKFRINFQRINHIFISHLHGDHYLGLCGLVSTYHLLGRKAPLQIFSPPGLKEILETQFKHSQTYIKFDLQFIELTGKTSKVIYEDKNLTIQSFPLKHRIPCFGFYFNEKPKLKNIKKESIDQYKISITDIPSIKKGADFYTQLGKKIENKLITKEQPASYSYAFCSDTAYLESIIPIVKGASLLYHEATFSNALKDRAKKTYHSTAQEAASIAKKAEVEKLIIGHISARYKNSEELLLEAQNTFPNTVDAYDGMTIRLY